MIMVIKKDGKQVGDMDTEDLDLDTKNDELQLIFDTFLEDGMETLGPPTSKIPKGVMGDREMVIPLTKESVGLFATKLQNMGFECSFK